MRLDIHTRRSQPFCDQINRHSVSAEIFVRVERHTGVSKAQIRGKSRIKGVSHARQMAMYLSDCEGRSLGQTGMMVNRHHSTVLQGIRAHARRIGVESPR